MVAVGAMAPMAAATPPPPPKIDFGNACGNTGAEDKGCGGKKTVQVPLTLSNPTGETLYFQIVAMYTCNGCSPAPTGPGPGVVSGTRGIWKTPHFGSPRNQCTAPTYKTGCGGTTNGTIAVPSGTVDATYWIETNPLGDASSFQSTVYYQWIDADCNPVHGTAGLEATSTVIPSGNC